MRGWALAAALCVVALAGCTDEPSEPALPERVHLLGDCPLTLPDGSPVDCMRSEWADVLDAPPEGWACYARWPDDAADPDIWTEVWYDGEGRVGLQWGWERWKPDGLAWQRLAVVESPTKGAVLNIPYATSGFAFIGEPLDPAGEVVLFPHVHQWRGFIEEEGAWRPASEVDFVLDRYGPQYWVTARYHAGDATYVMDLMHDRTDPEDDETAWFMRGFDGVIEGTPVYTAGTNDGAKFTNVDYQAMQDRLLGGSCGQGILGAGPPR